MVLRSKAVATGIALFATVGFPAAAASDVSGVAATKPPYRLVVVARRLSQPIHVAASRAEPGRLYVVQRAGLVRVLERGRLLPRPFLDLRGRVSTQGERGLLSIAFHPDYPATPRFFVFLTDRGGDVVVAEGSPATPAALRTLVRIPHDESLYHNGGQLAFGPDGLLYAGVGDGGYLGRDPDPRGNSQNLGVLLGKIFRLDVSRAQPTPELVAYGLRNPWRFSFGPNGDLLIGDVGFNAAEEVDLLPKGTAGLVNFGWSVYEGRQKRRTTVELNTAGTLLGPVLTYRTFAPGNCAITGGYVYRGSVPALIGRYVYGDYCSGRIWSARIEASRVLGVRREPFLVRDLASFGEDELGELYVVSLAGTIYRFARR